MTKQKWSRLSAIVIFALVIIFGGMTVALNAQDGAKPGKTKVAKFKQGEEVKLIGRVVDLQGFMTGRKLNANALQGTADNIKAGVPAALETEHGLVILGQGDTGPVKAVLHFAFQQVEVTGKLYRKGGVKYLDMTTINEATNFGPGSGYQDDEKEGEEEPE